MADYSVWILEESNITVSGGVSLDGITQGDGSHLVGETITLDNANWLETFVTEGDTTFDDNDGNQRLDGEQTIDGITYADGTRVEAEYRLVLEDSAGNTYEVLGFNVRNSSPAFSTVEGLTFVGPPAAWPPVGEPLTVIEATEGPGSGGQPDIPAADLVVPCFTPGTRIRTPHGQVPVEGLQVGDLVTTRDRGPRPVRWINRVSLGAADLATDPSLRPIRLRAGSLGEGRPRRDMLLSPQHRVLLQGWRTQLMFGTDEMLAAARHLVNGTSIDVAEDVSAVTYIHFMFDRHEVVYADGLEAESFRPGPLTLSGMSPGSQRELVRLFPELARAAAPAFTAARPLLKGWETAFLA